MHLFVHRCRATLGVGYFTVVTMVAPTGGTARCAEDGRRDDQADGADNAVRITPTVRGGTRGFAWW